MKINVHKIKLILAEREMTQTDLAERCGISKQFLSTILTRGTCEPKTVGKLANGLGIPPEEITKGG